MTGIETLKEINKTLNASDVRVSYNFPSNNTIVTRKLKDDIHNICSCFQLGIINPRLKVMEKMITSHFIDKLGKENVYLSIEDAIEKCKFSTSKPKKTISESGDSSKGAGDPSDDAAQQV